MTAPIGVNAAGVTGVRTPRIFDLQGSINVLDPSITPTQSCVRCAIFVNIIDSIVGADVEQVYSSTFKFCLLKNTRNLSPETLHFASKCTKNAFGGQALPGPAWGAYSAPPDLLAGLKGTEREGNESGKRKEWKGRWKRKGRGEGKRTPNV